MKRKPLSASFVTGAIALVFLIIGYEVAVFIHKAAVTRIEANRDHPDTVYVYVNSGEDATEEETLSSALLRNPVRANAPESVSPSVVRHNAKHSPVVEAVRARSRKVESFSFNPNTVSVEDLQRLGFSEKQALSIDNYRLKGGRFRRKEDFAKSYVVADSVYDRLEPYIVIPKLDINKADSTEHHFGISHRLSGLFPPNMKKDRETRKKESKDIIVIVRQASADIDDHQQQDLLSPFKPARFQILSMYPGIHQCPHGQHHIHPDHKNITDCLR